ncbi:MAG: hypothetical protein ACR2FN_03370 [Chitinophagaceae bacterium]
MQIQSNQNKNAFDNLSDEQINVLKLSTIQNWNPKLSGLNLN